MTEPQMDGLGPSYEAWRGDAEYQDNMCVRCGEEDLHPWYKFRDPDSDGWLCKPCNEAEACIRCDGATPPFGRSICADCMTLDDEVEDQAAYILAGVE